MKKKLIWLLIGAMMVGTLAGCGEKREKKAEPISNRGGV